MQTLCVKLFGEFHLADGEGTSIGINATERLQALLAYLLLHRDAPLPRQQIAIHIWPESPETEAKANLRRRLYDLRQLLPNIDQFLQVESKTLQWNSHDTCWLDVAEFDKAIARAEQAKQSGDLSAVTAALETAAELYQGDLFPGCYDDWIIPLREQFRRQAIQVYDALILQLAEQGDRQTAIGYAHRLLTLDPLSETAYGHLMRLFAQGGDRASALRVYHQCMTVLREELGVNPSPITCKIYEQILTLEDQPSAIDGVQTQSTTPSAGSVPELDLSALERLSSSLSSSPPPPADLPLIGRETEWTVIQDWQQACQNAIGTKLLLLLGEPGIGKTRLLAELAHQVWSKSGYVLWGQGFEAEILRPYGIWIDAFRSIQADEFLSELTALLLDAQPTADNTLNRGRLLDAGVAFLQQLTTQHPFVLIVIDDIQWLDEASIAFLHYAARLLSNVPIGFACAARKQELERNLAVSKVLQVFYREQGVQRLELAPLSSAHTIELAHRISQTINGEQVFADSGGNPLFTLEVARALSQATASDPNQPFSSDLTTLIQERLLPLDDSTRQLVSWAAALGRSFNPTTLAQVANCSSPQLLAALEQLEQHGIIQTGNTIKGEVYYNFSHDIIRQVAYQQLSEPRRRLVHTHIAQALNRFLTHHPDEVVNVAYHATLGGDHELAAAASLEAAERHLRLFAYTEASEVAQQGIHHCQYLEPASQLTLHLRLLRAYVKAGVRKDQVASLEAELQQLIEQASARGLKDAEAIGLETLIMLSYDHGRLTQVQQHSLQAAERMRSASPTTTAYMLAHTGSCLAEIGRDMARAESLLLEAQTLAERVGLQTIDIPLGLGFIRRYQGNVEEARQWLEQGWKMAQIEQDHWRECTCLVNLVMLELEADHLVNALNYCHELTMVSAQMGEGSEASHTAALDAVIHYRLGTPEADRMLERSRQSLQQLESLRMLAYVQTMAAEFDLWQGNMKQAIARAEEALAAAQRVHNPSEIALAWAVIIQASLQLGNYNCAIQHWQALQQMVGKTPLSHRAYQGMQAIQAQLRDVKS